MDIKQTALFSFTLITVSLLTACGGGGGDAPSAAAPPAISTPPTPPPPPPPPAPEPEPEPEPETEDNTEDDSQQNDGTVLTGVFIDAAVAGLHFKTDSQEGSTNAEGEFSFISGEKIVFSIGDITFPEVEASEMITPLTVFNTDNTRDPRVLNMARLLQTLDQDGTPGNGITITDDAHNQANGVSVDFSSNDFDAQVNDVIANAGADKTSLISAEEALTHLELSLGNMEISTDTCDIETDKKGFTGQLSSFAYEVAGTVTVIDGCTLEVTMFTYVDGGAPKVQFYTGNNLNFVGANSYGLGPNLEGKTFREETIVLSLPEGRSVNDFNSLSVWCVDFNVDFGSTVLRAP
ncbi:DM13 domain-containing protein [Agaribacter flavus]|uniref:DM13 domain-containing protein n=1 Tax=Agaribacter flavus TaxID=1902781 RepID=A0ABV7FNI6_9ALTE